MARKKRTASHQQDDELESSAGQDSEGDAEEARARLAGILFLSGMSLVGAVVIGGTLMTFFIPYKLVMLAIFRALSLVVTAAALATPLVLWVRSDPEHPGRNFAPARLGIVAFAALMLFSTGAREGLPVLNPIVGGLVCAPGYDTLVAPSVAKGLGVANYLVTEGWFPQCIGKLGFYEPRKLAYMIAMMGVFLALVLLWFALDWPVARLLAARGRRVERFVVTPLLFVLVLSGLFRYPAPFEWATRPLNHVLASTSRPSLMDDAIERDDLAALRSRLEAGDRVDGFYLPKHPPLYKALSFNRLDAARLLLEHGADVNIRDSKDHTALYYAAATGDVPIVEAVLARGADVNIVSRDGETALYRAAKAQRWEIVKLLLERQANPAAGDEAHKSSLLMALAGKAPPEIVELLLERGAAVNVKGEKDFTPLLFAAKNGNWSAVVRIVEHGADVRIADEYGRTALHFAAEISRHGPHDQQERGIAMAALLDRKADVNARDSNGATPLHLMLERITNGLSRGNDWYLQNPGDQKPDLALVSLLVKHGADTTLKTRRPSLTPVDYVRRVSRPEVRRALQSALEGR